MNSDTLLIPLAALATELGRPADTLAAELGDNVLLDSVGFRAVERGVAQRLLDDHRNAQQAAEQAKRAKAERQAAEQQRLARRQQAEAAARAQREAHQAEILARNPDMTAYELMIATDDDPDRNTPAGRRFDDLIRLEREGAIGRMYRFNPTSAKD